MLISTEYVDSEEEDDIRPGTNEKATRNTSAPSKAVSTQRNAESRPRTQSPPQSPCGVRRVEVLQTPIASRPTATEPPVRESAPQSEFDKRKKGRIEGVRASAKAIFDAGRAVKRSLDNTWRVGPRAPMMLSRIRENGKLRRTQRIVRRQALTIAASGAAACAAEEIEAMADAFGIDVPTELEGAPWLPALTDGALLSIEQALCAYMQESLWHAAIVCGGEEGVESKRRVTAEAMKHGFRTADHNNFSFGSFALDDGSLYICNRDQKKRKRVAGAGAGAGDK
jgi:hypothetical protein